MAVSSFFNRLKFWKRTIDHDSNRPEHRLETMLKRYEKCVSEIESIIMWDNPVLSVLAVIVVNILFWSLVSLELRPFGLIGSIMLAFMVHDTWTFHVWPEISVSGMAKPPFDTPVHPSVVALSKMGVVLHHNMWQNIVWLRNFRMQHPGLFCCACSVTCLCLMVLGRAVSGLTLLYSLLMAFLLIPGPFKRYVPPDFKLTIDNHIACVRVTIAKYSSDASDDEYIPVTTSEDMALLTRASDLMNDTYDSLTNPGSSSDMVSGMGLMPSHEEDSLATLSDLEPSVNQLPLDPTEDSDSNPEDHQIQFQSGHFNGDSSSDEDAFTGGLVFTETDERDSAATRGLSSLIAQAVTSNLMSSVGLLATVTNSALLRQQQSTDDSRTRQRPRRSDTDSDLDDFEIIEREDLNGQ